MAARISTPLHFSKAREVALVTDNQGVQHIDAEKVAAYFQSMGDIDVIRRWRRFAARVVVGNDNARGMMQDRGQKHFPRMHQRGVEGSDADNVPPNDPPIDVERQNAEVLHDFAGEQGRDDLRGVSRCQDLRTKPRGAPVTLRYVT
jgi:hypothetical protein